MSCMWVCAIPITFTFKTFNNRGCDGLSSRKLERDMPNGDNRTGEVKTGSRTGELNVIIYHYLHTVTETGFD